MASMHPARPLPAPEVRGADGPAPCVPTAPDAFDARAWGRALLRHLLFVALLSLAIAVLLGTLERGAGRFGPNLVYALAIGLACLAFVDGGRLAAAVVLQRRRRGGPALPRERITTWAVLAPTIVLAALFGPALGLAIGDALTGGRSPRLWDLGSPSSRLTLTLSVLGTLLGTFVGVMAERLARARADAEAARRLASETQLRLLQSQLEPHMLFNTLANLRVLIGLDPPAAQAMLDRLIAFLRTTLAASQVREHTLEREFAWLSDYLALMAVRMGPRLSVQLDLPPALAGRPVPPLVLQPLVENAIRHGLEPQAAQGRLEVRARLDRGTLVLTVRDTGRGLPAGADSSGGFGLTQVRARLAALYGDRAGLALAPGADAEGGTLATVTLPAA
jgi:sensor histidine kinase YesM